MLYGFVPVNNRRVIVASHNYHLHPELHPSRLLDVHDIFYVIDGYFSVRIENEEYRFNHGDVAVLPAGFHHYGCRLCRAKSHTIFIHFSKEPGDMSPPLTTSNLLLLESVIHADTQAVYQYFQEIVKLFREDVPHGELRCSAALSLLLAQLHDCSTDKRVVHDKDITRLLSFIFDHPHVFFSIPELAAHIGMSKKSLTTRFKAETGQTVHTYQMNSKLDQIAVLLRSESYTSLKRLADNFGFYDEFHLSASFKKKFGMPPNQYVKKSAR